MNSFINVTDAILDTTPLEFTNFEFCFTFWLIELFTRVGAAISALFLNVILSNYILTLKKLLIFL